MQYVVLMSIRSTFYNTEGRGRIHTQVTAIPAHDKRDAMAMAAALSSNTVSELECGKVHRYFDVGVKIPTAKGFVTLTLDQIEMIANEYTADHT